MRALRRFDRRYAPFVSCALLLACTLAFAQKKPPATPLDLNTATVEQLQQLPGIGPSTAQAIVRFRTKSGPFRRIEDLRAIHGISKKRLDAIRPYITVTPSSSGYRLLKRIALGGDGGWDYLAFDSATRRLFISRATKVIVLDVDSEKVVGEIPNTDGVHGIALAPDLARGFTSNGRTGSITIFDLKTLATIGTVPAGKNPDAIVYDPASKRVFAMNGRGSDSTAIDGATGKVLATIPLAAKPEFAVSDEAGHVYVNIEDKSELWQIDSQKLAVTAHWPLAPCVEPSGLAIDAAHRRLFAGCDNKMMAVVNADTGKVIATPAIGEGVDANAYDPGTAFAFSSNGESGTLTVVHEDSPDQFTVVEDVPTKTRARTMALDPKTHEVFLVTADFGPRPPATPEQPRPRPPILPGTFVVLVFGK
ncbi:MAG TPA: helix-hairpin-helix domain-containing protein [Candidatus Sulfotelmatobacter sp.]|nr:helix-hairpin-helix domain-containing protein [Candidatus Sulfotelmatobacter sp.]